MYIEIKTEPGDTPEDVADTLFDIHRIFFDRMSNFGISIRATLNQITMEALVVDAGPESIIERYNKESERIANLR